ncbi:hypothetical protein EDB80DRAFT_749601 [Ilyonectria destructans]|nr:hypothetical protein EDB80DRAFT_749601 [Ilyonectria destructans]
MAAAVAPPMATGHKQPYPTPPRKELPRSLIEGARITPEPFDASKHIHFEYPKKCCTMKDIGKEGAGISTHAISEPFPLFTNEAIKQFRGEIFSDRVLEKYQCGSGMATNMIRGYCPKEAPFIYNAWNSPEVLDNLSKIAGIELVPAMDIDIGHVNVSVKGDNESIEIPKDLKEEDMTAFDWHYDAYAFVCVTMLSDCTGMVGGETAIRCGNGEVMKARGPTMGTAVLMQGRYIEHQALKALGGRERIAMVTSLRPKSAWIRDENVVSPLRGISPATHLFYQYAEYRLVNLEERVRSQLKQMRTHNEAGYDIDWDNSKKFLLEQKEYIEGMLSELEACSSETL